MAEPCLITVMAVENDSRRDEIYCTKNRERFRITYGFGEKDEVFCVCLFIWDGGWRRIVGRGLASVTTETNLRNQVNTLFEEFKTVAIKFLDGP